MTNLSLMAPSLSLGGEEAQSMPSLDNAAILSKELFAQNLELAEQNLEHRDLSSLGQDSEGLETSDFKKFSQLEKLMDGDFQGKTVQIAKDADAAFMIDKWKEFLGDKQIVKQQEVLDVLKREHRGQLNNHRDPFLAVEKLNLSLDKISSKEGLKKFQNQAEGHPLFSTTAKGKVPEDSKLLQSSMLYDQPATLAELSPLTDKSAPSLGQMPEAKSFAIDHFASLRTVDTGQLIEKITHYIDQRTVGTMRKVDLSVNHGEIGNFRIQASQDLGQNGIDLTITIFGREGADFFGPNQSKLLSSLAQRGIQVQDFKLDQQFSSEQDYQSFSSENGQSEHSREDQNSQRRKQIWKELLEESV